jgi:hypothetical protein
MAKSSENHSQSQMLVLLTIKFFILKSIVLPGGGGDCTVTCEATFSASQMSRAVIWLDYSRRETCVFTTLVESLAGRLLT